MNVKYKKPSNKIRKEFLKNYQFLKIRNNMLTRVVESKECQQKAQFVLPRRNIEEIHAYIYGGN